MDFEIKRKTPLIILFIMKEDDDVFLRHLLMSFVMLYVTMKTTTITNINPPNIAPRTTPIYERESDRTI